MTRQNLIRCVSAQIGYSGTPRILSVPIWEVEEGERVGLAGRSGAGKTSFLKAILNEEVARAGTILVSPILAAPGKTGYVSQRTELVPWWTCKRHVEVAALNRDGLRQDPLELLRQVGLNHAAEKYPNQLSGGMARRLLVATVLASQPKLLMLDEALSGLDPYTKNDLVETVNGYCEQRGATLIHVTHDLQEMVSLTSRIDYIQHDSELIQGGFISEACGLPYSSEQASREALRLYIALAKHMGEP